MVYARTESPLLSALGMFGSSFAGLVGATTLLSVADRVPPRAALTLVAFAAAIAGLLLAMPGSPLPMMFAVILAQGLVTSIGAGVLYGLLGEILRPEGTCSAGRCSICRSVRCRWPGLRSAVCGVRDPHIVGSAERERFYLIATDLRGYAGRGWERHQRRGRRSIVDWDPEQEAYLVHWSSTVYDNADHERESYHRIMYATTRDFREFSAPRVWIDRGWQTIDTTVIEHEGVYYRLLKDEQP